MFSLLLGPKCSVVQLAWAISAGRRGCWPGVWWSSPPAESLALRDDAFCWPLVCFCFVLYFRATLETYGSSKARGRIRATAASLHHSSRQHRQHRILDPTEQVQGSNLHLPGSHSGSLPLSYNGNSLWLYSSISRSIPTPGAPLSCSF